MATVYGPKGISEALKAQLVNKGKTDVAETVAGSKGQKQELEAIKTLDRLATSASKDLATLRGKGDKSVRGLNTPEQQAQWIQNRVKELSNPTAIPGKRGELDEFGMPKTEAIASLDENSPFKLATVNYDDKGNVIPSVDSGLPNTNPGGDNVLSPGAEPPPIPMSTTPVGPPANNLAAANWMPTETPQDSWEPPETPRLADNQWTPQADEEEQRKRQEILMAFLSQYQDSQGQDEQQYG
jgi:hypothetical protein